MTTRIDRTAVLSVSGGMDSCVLVYYYASAGFNLHLLSFDYGQKNVNELTYAEKYIAKAREHFCKGSNAIEIMHRVIALPLAQLLENSDSALINASRSVPYGPATTESLKAITVPYRNPNMLIQATTAAWDVEASIVAYAAHYNESPLPDAREVFVQAFNEMLTVAMNTSTIKVEAPFLSFTKAQIVRLGASFNAPFELTWSCFEGGSNGLEEKHCGKCATCLERYNAFKLAGVPDPTLYANNPKSYQWIFKGEKQE